MSGLYRHKNSPYWQYDFQHKGKRYHGSTGLTAKADARAYVNRLRAELLTAPKGARPPITLDEAAGLYAARIEEKPGYRTSKPILAAMVAGLGGQKLLAEITQHDLLRFVARRRDGRSNSSVNREIEDWRATWRWASLNKFDVGDMPNWGGLLLTVQEMDPRELSADEETRLFAALRPDLHGMARFALRSGWRLQEVLQLRWKDLHLGERVARTRVKGGRIVSRALSREMLAIITSQPKVAPQVFTFVCQQSRAGGTDAKGRHSATRRKGERYPFSLTGWRSPWESALKAAKIEDFRFHDLRHTTATRLLRATGNLKATQTAMKHKSIKTTLRYAHALDEDVRNAYDLADATSASLPAREAEQSRNSPGTTKGKSRKIG